MNVVRGVASRVTQSQEIVDRHEDLSVGQVMACQIGGRDVHISMPTVPNIRNGDEVVVAGWIKQGTLHARAYRNLDSGSYGRWKYNAWTLFVGAPLVIGITVMLPYLLPFSLFWAAWDWWGAFRTYRAYHAVLAESGKRADRDRRILANEDDDAEEALPIEPARQPLLANVSFPCPQCGKRLKMNREAVGKKVRCPSGKCGVVINTGRSAC